MSLTTIAPALVPLAQPHRRAGPFVTLTCAAITELFISMLLVPSLGGST